MSHAPALGEGTTKPDNVVKVDKWGSPLSSTSHAKNIGEVHSNQIPKYGMLPTSRVAKKTGCTGISARPPHTGGTADEPVVGLVVGFGTDVPQGGRIAMNH